jgi:hypothetical protein
MSCSLISSRPSPHLPQSSRLRFIHDVDANSPIHSAADRGTNVLTLRRPDEAGEPQPTVPGAMQQPYQNALFGKFCTEYIIC